MVHRCKGFLPLMKRALPIVSLTHPVSTDSSPRRCRAPGAHLNLRCVVLVTLCGKRWHIWETIFRLPVPCLRTLKPRLRSAPKGVLYAKSESTQVLECEKMQAWFYTSAEQAATDILVGVTKGKIKIHVGRGTGWFDWLSRLLPVSYSRLF